MFYRCQTSYWASFRRYNRPVRHEALAVRSNQRQYQTQNPSPIQGRHENLLPRRNQFDGLNENEGNGRSVPRQDRHKRSHHRPRLFQRLPKTGHERRRNHCRIKRSTYHQRTHSRRYRVRLGQERRRREKRTDFRSRRWHLRCIHPNHRRWYLWSQVDGRRHPFGRWRFR